MSENPLIVAWGHEAGSGKDACVSHLMNLYSGSNILHCSFARALRKQIHDEMYDVMAQYHCTPSEALKALCEREGVKYDPFAEPTESDPFGKQRLLLQSWGSRRRAERPNYWINEVHKEIDQKKPDLVLLSDLRYENEAEWVKSLGGTTVKVLRPTKASLGDGAGHISEHSLSKYKFDYTILNDGTLKQLHERAARLYLQILQRPLF